MFIEQHDEFYYLMLYNQNQTVPARPESATEDAIVRGGYCLEPMAGTGPAVHLLGSGAILSEVLTAAAELRQDGYAVAVFSITSYIELAREAERWERRETHDSASLEVSKPWVCELLGSKAVPTVAASDYVCALPRMIASWVAGPYAVLGTDGFGLSETRGRLREHFGVDAATIVRTAKRLAADQGA